MTYAKLKEIANEALIKQLFELTNLSLETDYLWFFHCSTKQKICTDTKAKPDYKNSVTYVNNKLKLDCHHINEPSYFLINQNEIKSIQEKSIGLELAFLFPLATSNNDPFIMVTHKEIEVYQLEEIKKETKKILRFLNIVLSSFPEITTKPSAPSAIKSIMIQEKQKGTVYAFSDVLYLEAHGNYTYVHIVNRTKPALKTAGLKYIEEKLPEDIFIRIHKSILINKHHVVNYDYSKDTFTITLSNGKELPVATRKKNDLLLALKGCNIVF